MNCSIEKIKETDNETICSIIKAVGAEHGAIGDGFGPSDPEVLCMSRYYKEDNNSIYFVVSVDDIVVGGGGIAAFNASSSICELRKLFLLPASRGLGLGQKLADYCLTFAKQKGYQQCYLDTLSSMKPAILLYEKLGFKHLNKPLNGTIHGGCDIWMMKDL